MIEELYRETVLDHHRHPRHRETLPDPTIRHRGVNPYCGDEVTLDLRIEGDRLAEIAFGGRGCAISQASASMLAELVAGASLAEAATAITGFRAAIQSGRVDADALGDAAALVNVRRFPARTKCALLAWHTLREVLETYSRAPAI